MKLTDDTKKEHLEQFAFRETISGTIREFKIICARDNVSKQSKATQIIQEFNKIHGEGNPIYPITKFIDPDFKAVPATLERQEKWLSFIKKTDNETLKQLEYQCYMIMVMAKCYLKIPKHERKERNFTSLRQMEIYKSW
tara:strand:+ start:2271 stop:2687 length:417 start_codon:yes stop_codon:yes gene_type:complete